MSSYRSHWLLLNSYWQAAKSTFLKKKTGPLTEYDTDNPRYRRISGEDKHDSSDAATTCVGKQVDFMFKSQTIIDGLMNGI